MTSRIHVTDFYMDGFTAIAFCKVCSMEDLTGYCEGYPTVKTPEWLEQQRRDNDRDYEDSLK